VSHLELHFLEVRQQFSPCLLSWEPRSSQEFKVAPHFIPTSTVEVDSLFEFRIVSLIGIVDHCSSMMHDGHPSQLRPIHVTLRSQCPCTMCGANQFCFDHGHEAVAIWVQSVPPNVGIYEFDFVLLLIAHRLITPPVRFIFIMAVSISRLHARWAVGDKPQYNNHSKLLAHDEPLISSLKLDRMSGSLVHSKSFLRTPLGKLCNLHVGPVIPDVSGAWSHVRKCDLAIPAQSSYRDATPLSTAVNIQHTEPEQTSPSTIPHPGDIITHPSVARTLQTFRAELPKSITWADTLPAPRSPIIRPSKRSRTPFPVAEMDRQRNTSEDKARSLSPKRLRTGLCLPSVDVPFLVPHAVVSGKRGQTNLHHLVRWLTGYLYFLISNPNRSSRVPRYVAY
jgi:hypothetical protein